jgi:hypothetical protein
MLAPLAFNLPISRDDSTQWFVLVVGVLATCYVVMRGRVKAGRTKDPFNRKPVPMGVSQQKQIERDMGGLMVQMLETARHMAAQLDTRAARLEVLMKEADAKLAALKTAAATAPARIATSEPSSAVDEARADRADDADEAPVAPQVKPETPPDPRHGEIYALADQGRSSGEIARQLNRPNGEVELILALRSR